MTNDQFEKIFATIYRFLDSSGGRAEGFKSESWGSNLTLQHIFSYFSKNFMTKKNSPKLIFLLKTFSIMFLEVQKHVMIGTCA